MSYDLYFEAGPGKKLDRKSFTAYFKERPNYQLANGQVLYQNEDTGVYFIFDEPAEGVVAFALNFFRPHTFGLEAGFELEAFAKAFEAEAMDESGEGGPFDKRAFFKSWHEGNRFGYRAMLAEADGGPVHTWPAKRLREVWEWNYARPAEAARVGEDVFVPGIFAIDVDGEVLSVAIWPPECPILLPAVDGVLVPLAQQGKGTEDLALVRWADVLPVVKPYAEKGAGLARYRLAFEGEWPAAVAAFLDKRRKAAGELKGVGFDELLDRESVEEALAQG
jgi:hypothetical protein